MSRFWLAVTLGTVGFGLVRTAADLVAWLAGSDAGGRVAPGYPVGQLALLLVLLVVLVLLIGWMLRRLRR